MICNITKCIVALTFDLSMCIMKKNKILVAPWQRTSVLELKKGMGCKAPRGNGAVSAKRLRLSVESRSLGKPEKAGWNRA